MIEGGLVHFKKWTGKELDNTAQYIKDYIKELPHDRFEALNISADRIACELAKMAFADLDDTNTTASKARALDLLQKQLGLQTQKVQASTEQSIKISIKQKEKDDGEGD